MLKLIQKYNDERLLGYMIVMGDVARIDKPLIVYPKTLAGDETVEQHYVVDYYLERLIPHQLSDDDYIDIQLSDIEYTMNVNQDTKEKYKEYVDVLYAEDFNRIFEECIEQQFYASILNDMDVSSMPKQ